MTSKPFAILFPLLVASAAFAQAEPATTQSSPPAESSAEISPEVRPLLDRLRDAYLKPGPWLTEATITGDFDVSGRQRMFEMRVVGTADGEGRFDHHAIGVGRVVQTSEKAFIFDARRNAFANLERKPERRPADDVPDAVSQILIDENPSLLLSLTTEPDKLLVAGAKRISAKDGAIVIESDHDLRTITLDGRGMITSMTIDYASLLAQRGAAAVKKAIVTLNYTRADRTPPAVDAFAFEVPKGASEFRLTSELMRDRVKDAVRRAGPRGAAATTASSTQPAKSD